MYAERIRSAYTLHQIEPRRTRSSHVSACMPSAPLGIQTTVAVRASSPSSLCRAAVCRRPRSAYRYMPSEAVCRADSACLPTRLLPKAIRRRPRSAYTYAERFWLYAEWIWRSAYRQFPVVGRSSLLASFRLAEMFRQPCFHYSSSITQHLCLLLQF
jgi:hypothetical protein